MTQREVFDWLDQDFKDVDQKVGLSCAIQVANKESILTANAESEIDLQSRSKESENQRWIIYNRQDFNQHFWTRSYNIWTPTSFENPYLSAASDGNLELSKEDDESGRQRWNFSIDHFDYKNGPDNRFTIRVGNTNPLLDGKKTNGLKFLSSSSPKEEGKDSSSSGAVGLVKYEDYEDGNQLWDLIDCFETPTPDRSALLDESEAAQ